MRLNVSTGEGVREGNILSKSQPSIPFNTISFSYESTNIPIRLNAIVAPTVPAPIIATLEAVGVGIVA
jgi:hypothetical protein